VAENAATSISDSSRIPGPGRYFGSAVAAGKLGDNTCVTILDREFNSVTHVH
jgi:endo-1,4-beta-xylanase